MSHLGTHTTATLAISSDQQLLASMLTDHKTRIWKLAGMEEVASIPTHDGSAYRSDFLFGGSKLLAYQSQGIALWDIEEEAELIRFPEYLNAEGQFVSSPDGNLLAICQDGVIHLIDGRSISEAERQTRKSSHQSSRKRKVR